MKAMTNTGLAPYRSNVGTRSLPNFRDVLYIADAEACQFGTVPELVNYLKSLLYYADDEEGDIRWQGRNGYTFFCGEEARKHIVNEIAALENGTHWSLTDSEWREEMADKLAE
jgi:hypothetical protein